MSGRRWKQLQLRKPSPPGSQQTHPTSSSSSSSAQIQAAAEAATEVEAEEVVTASVAEATTPLQQFFLGSITIDIAYGNGPYLMQ